MNLQEISKDHFSVIPVRDRLKSSFGLVHSESDSESESTQEKEESQFFATLVNSFGFQKQDNQMKCSIQHRS